MVVLAPGKDVVEKSKNFNLYDYSTRFSQYYDYYANYPDRLFYATSYTQHFLLRRYFLQEIAKELWKLNNKFGNHEDYYKLIYEMLYAPALDEVELQQATGYYDKTKSQIFQLMAEGEVKLSTNTNLPCKEN